MKDLGWTTQETIGMGIINTRLMETPVQKLYRLILKDKLNARVIDIQGDTYVLDVYRPEGEVNILWSRITLRPKRTDD